MPKAIVTGLDVGTSSIRVAVCEAVRGSKAPRVLALTKSESRGLRRGYIINAEEAAQAIRSAIAEAEKVAQTRIKHVFLGLGGVTVESKIGEGQVVVSRADSEITDNDINRVIELSELNLTDNQNGRIIHIIPLYFKLDGKKILGRPEGMRGSKLEVRTLFVTCLNQHLTNLLRAVELAGLTVEDVVASPIAASFLALSNQQKAAGVVLANIGSQTTSIAVFEEGIPVSLSILPIGSLDITNDIALGLRVPLDEAERIKIGSENVVTLKKKLDEIIEARLSDMFELIEGHLKKIGRSGLLPAGLVLSGGGAALPNLDRLAKEELKLPARVLTPVIDAAGKTQIKDPAWLVAYGLCLFGLGAELGESVGTRLFRRTKGKFLQWLRELLP